MMLSREIIGKKKNRQKKYKLHFFLDILNCICGSQIHYIASGLGSIYCSIYVSKKKSRDFLKRTKFTSILLGISNYMTFSVLHTIFTHLCCFLFM